MLKTRLIPVVLMREGFVVQSKGFRRYQRLGNPITIVERLSDWASDELIHLDISRRSVYDLGRDDLGVPNLHSILDILKHVARQCFMPLTFGGGIRTLEDVRVRIRLGADKVTINTQALSDPDFVSQCAMEFGSQCIVICIDVKLDDHGGWEVFTEGGRVPTGRHPADWAAEAERRGAGEILLSSIDQDGSGHGYDIALVRSVVDAVKIPVIALGGVGEWEHLKEGIVREHDLRGYDFTDMIDEEEGIEEKDMIWARMPSDAEIAEVGVRGIYIGNYFMYDPNKHAPLMREKYGFEFARQPFERTYRIMSNLDDMHENGIHDYMKFIKFGYGRASDHSSLDIRLGHMTREEGIKIVQKYDHVKPRRDLERWLNYVGMAEEEFDRIADTFRDPRVWRKENGEWVKDNIWEEQ